MKEEIVQNLMLAINILDQISVSGRQNRNNLSGGIGILEKIAEVLAEAEISLVDRGDENVDTSDNEGRNPT